MTDFLTDALIHGDRYTLGSDNAKRKARNAFVTLKVAQQNTNPAQAKRLRDIAREFPTMSEGAAAAIARSAAVLDEASVAPLAFVDTASQAEQGTLGQTTKNLTPQGALNGPASGTLNIAPAPAAGNPHGSSRAAPGTADAPEPDNSIPKALIGVPLAALGTLLTATSDLAWRRSSGVRKEVTYRADKYQMDPATRYAFAQAIAGQDQMSGVPVLEPFMPDDPRDPENIEQVKADYEAGNYDKDLVTKAVAEWNDPTVGYQGNREGGWLERNWHMSPLGQLVRHGNYGSSWIGMPEENYQEIEQFNSYQYDIRGTAERDADLKAYEGIMRRAREQGVLESLDPATLFAVYGPRGGTLGRYMAEYNAGYDPNTWPYRILSGAVDLVSTMALDPVSYVPGAAVTDLGKLGLNAAHRGALATPGVRAITPAVRSAEGAKTAVFETTRTVRIASSKNAKWVTEDGKQMTDKAAPQDPIVWKPVEGVEMPYRKSDDTEIIANGVQTVRKFESSVGGKQHGVVYDAEDGLWGYVGPLDITDKVKTPDELMGKVINHYMPDFEDATPPKGDPKPSDIYSEPSTPGELRLDETGTVKQFDAADGIYKPFQHPRDRRLKRIEGGYEVTDHMGNPLTIQRTTRSKGVYKYELRDADGNVLHSSKGLQGVKDYLYQKADDAVAGARNLSDREPLSVFRYAGGVIEEQADGTWKHTVDPDLADVAPIAFKTDAGEEYRRVGKVFQRFLGDKQMVMEDGVAKYVGGFETALGKMGFVTAREANRLRAAHQGGRFEDVDGVLNGTKHIADSAFKRDVFDALRKEGIAYDEAWVKAGGLIEDVEIIAKNAPESRLVPVEWAEDLSALRTGKGEIFAVETGAAPRARTFATGDEAAQDVADQFARRNGFKQADEHMVVDRNGNMVSSHKRVEEARDAALKSSGHTPEHPNTYLTIAQVNHFLKFTGQGQKIVKTFIDMTSPAAIWRASKGKIDFETATMLADAKTADDVLSILGTRIGSTISDAKALERFVGPRAAFNRALYRTEQSSDAMRAVYRLGHLAPRDRAVRLDDPDEVMEMMTRWGQGVGHQWETADGVTGIQDYIDLYLRHRDDPGFRYALFNAEGVGFFDAVVRQALKDAGAPPDVSRALSRAYRSKTDYERTSYKGSVLSDDRIKVKGDLEAKMLDARVDLTMIRDNRIGEGTWLMGDQLDIPLFLDEAGRTFMPVPNYRAVRRQINLISQTLRKMPGGQGAQATYDLMGEWASTASMWWRNFTLMNPAYFVRNVTEEMFRMGLSGDKSLFSNPLEAVATCVTIAASRTASNNTSRVLQSMMLLGMPSLARRIQRKVEDPDSIHMVKMDAFVGGYDMPDPAAMATSLGGKKEITQDGLANSLARSGTADPIIVEYQVADQTWHVKDGKKRLAAWESMPPGKRPDYIPVRIVETQGRLASKTVNSVPVAATIKTVRTPRRRAPYLDVDDTRFKGNPEHLFGRGTSKGTLAKLIEQGKTDAADYGALNAMLGYSIPMFRHKFAYLNGDEWNKAHNAAIAGNWDDVSDRITRASTLAAGSYMQDEAAMRISSMKIVDRQRDLDAHRNDYVRMLAIRQKQVSDLPYVKNLMAEHPLEDDMNRYVDEWILRKPEEARKLAALLEGSSKYDSFEKLAEAAGKRSGDVPVEQVKQIIGAQLETAWILSGKGGAPDLLEAMHTGVYKGAQIGPDNVAYLDRLKEIMDDVDLRVAFPETLSGKPPTSWHANKKEWLASKPGRLVEWFFNTAGENRDLLTASPMMREHYVNAAIQLVHHMTPNARQAILKNLRDAGDTTFLRKFQQSVDGSQGQAGWLDVDGAHLIASRRATDHLKEIFYDAAERQNWAVAMKVIFPFAQAQVNTIAVWGKLMLTRPIDSYRTMRPINAMNNEWSMTSYDLLNDQFGGQNPDPELEPPLEPFMVRGAGGDDRYVMPAFGVLARLLNVRATATGTTSSVNFISGGVVPGAGPVVSIPASMFADGLLNSPTWQGDIARAVWKYPLPKGSPLDKVMGGLLPGKWQDGIVQIGDSRSPEFVKKTMGLFQQEIATGRKENGQPYDMNNRSDVEEALAVAEGRARRLLALETFTKVFLPAAGPLTYDADMVIKPGDNSTVEFVANREMAQVWQSYTGNVTGQEYGLRVQEFAKDFGPFTQFPFAPVTDNKDTPPLTFEMQKIAADLPTTYRKYNSLWRYVMPTGDPYGSIFDSPRLAQYRESQGKEGYRKALTPKEVIDQQFQYMIGGVMLQRLDEAERTNPGDAGLKQRIRDEAFANGYRQELTLDKARATIDEIGSMLEDEVARDAVPGGDAIYAYIQERNATIARMQRYKVKGDSWSGALDTQAAMPDANNLWVTAMRLQGQDGTGSFTRFWETAGRLELGQNADLIEELR